MEDQSNWFDLRDKLGRPINRENGEIGIKIAGLLLIADYKLQGFVAISPVAALEVFLQKSGVPVARPEKLQALSSSPTCRSYEPEGMLITP